MKQGRDTTKEERLEIVKDCLAPGKNYGEMERDLLKKLDEIERRAASHK